MQTGAGPTFGTVEDSPMFRSTVSDLEETLDRLENRCNRFVKGSKKYKEGVNTMAQAQLSFADFLEEFCGGTDEESMLLGGSMMSKFVGVYRELASFTELLNTQVELMLVERLHHNWLKGLLTEGRDCKRQLDRKVAEYDTARLKHLGHKANPRPSKWRKGDDSEKIHNDMVHAQAAAEEARFECARKLTELESRKRYEFVEAMTSSMEAHLRFYERGHELLKNLEPYIAQGMSKVGQLKEEQQQSKEGLEAMIFSYREEKYAREARAADVAERPLSRPGGPVQLSSNMSASIASIEGYIRESEESQGSIVTALKQGYLLKRSSNIRKEWKRRFFVLDSLGMLYYYSNKERVDNRKTPQNTVKLLTSTIKAGADEEGLRYCFRVVSPEKIYLLQAEDELDQQEWMEAIQGVTACLLNGDVDIEALSRAQPKPARPTHSRQGSRAGSISSLDDISFSPMGQAVSHQGSDLSSLPNGLPLDAESGRSSEEIQTSPHSMTSPGRRHTTLGPSPLSAKAPRAVHGHSSSFGASQKSFATTPRQRSTTPAGMLAPQGSGKLFARAASPNSPLDILRRVPGNSACCDCGSPEPDWASLNLGTLLCIECSGIHRRLGVHVSKVRSLTLDVKVWDEPVLSMMEGLGNEVANDNWEAELHSESAKADSWVWCDDEGDESEPGFNLARAGSMGSQPRGSANGASPSFSFPAKAKPPEFQGQNLPPLSPRGAREGSRGAQASSLAQPSSARAEMSAKPRPSDSLPAKEHFITAKYVERRYISLPETYPGATAQTGLWEAVEGGNLREVARAVAGGAEINACCTGQPAMELIRDTNALAGGANLEPPTSTANLTALHFACQIGDIGLVEFLLQNGAKWDRADPYGRTPLHYSILHEHPVVAKQLLKRGADNTVQDVLGRTALDLAVGKGKLADNDLFVMLSPPDAAFSRLM